MDLLETPDRWGREVSLEVKASPAAQVLLDSLGLVDNKVPLDSLEVLE